MLFEIHNDVMIWTHFLHYWPFVWGIHQHDQLPMNSSTKGHGAVSQQAITWANVDLEPCRYMRSLGHNELKTDFVKFT